MHRDDDVGRERLELGDRMIDIVGWCEAEVESAEHRVQPGRPYHVVISNRIYSRRGYRRPLRIISRSVSLPSVVSSYGAFLSGFTFLTRPLRLRYCIKAFMELCGMPRASRISMILTSLRSAMNDKTRNERSDLTISGGSPARAKDSRRWGCAAPSDVTQ